MLIRRIALTGATYADDDWTNPSTPPPDNAGPFKATATSIKFALKGKASMADDAAVVSLAGAEVNAFVALDLGNGTSRGQSILEVVGDRLAAQVVLVASDVIPGQIYRLNLRLTGVGALAAIDAELISGGRRL